MSRQLVHGKSLLALLAGTYVGTGAASSTVKSGNGHAELILSHTS